ncbi:hypothetical protein [Paucibacter sp. B51]|uniref:hypothetical protein n=1 Tax=Paucibacter sp. B51 TaxID=2993315 RepID=UPI0022EBEC26|nr:hypothetical protein [Paucibacter sp. B51]
MTSDKPVIELVPADFPRSSGGSVSGAQSKLIVRKIDGRFVGGMTDEELWVRYDACRDLAMKLTEHAQRKRGQYAKLSQREFLRRLRAGVVKRGWDLAVEEFDWVMQRVAVAMGGEPGDVQSWAALDVSPLTPGTCLTEAQVETLVDCVRAKLLQGMLSTSD